RYVIVFFFFSSRRRHTRSYGDWSSDVCSSDLGAGGGAGISAEHDQHGPAQGVGEYTAIQHAQRDVENDAAGHELRRCADALDGEIGRASCRERVWRSVADGAWQGNGCSVLGA